MSDNHHFKFCIISIIKIKIGIVIKGEFEFVTFCFLNQSETRRKEVNLFL